MNLQNTLPATWTLSRRRVQGAWPGLVERIRSLGAPGLVRELDALDHESVAVPEHEELAGRGDATRGVDEEAVAVAQLRLHRGDE